MEWPSRPEAVESIKNRLFYEIDDLDELQLLQDSDYNTGGVEVYFTRYLEFAAGAHWTPGDYAGSAQGLTVAVYKKDEDEYEMKEYYLIAQTVAHELGHACGLDDIYIKNKDIEIPVEKPKYSWMQDDWNNGPGPQYYDPHNYQSDIIKNLLMYGVGSKVFGGIDIPYGRVKGIDRPGNFTDIKTGLIDMNRTPEHW